MKGKGYFFFHFNTYLLVQVEHFVKIYEKSSMSRRIGDDQANYFTFCKFQKDHKMDLLN